MKYSPPKKSIWGHKIGIMPTKIVISGFNKILSNFTIISKSIVFDIEDNITFNQSYSADDFLVDSENCCELIDAIAESNKYPTRLFDIYINVECKPHIHNCQFGNTSSLKLIIGNNPHLIPRLDFGMNVDKTVIKKFLANLNTCKFVKFQEKYIKL